MYVTGESPLGHEPLTYISWLRVRRGANYPRIRVVRQSKSQLVVGVGYFCAFGLGGHCCRVPDSGDEVFDLMPGKPVGGGGVAEVGFGFEALGFACLIQVPISSGSPPASIVAR
jgi:hypothetical protein